MEDNNEALDYYFSDDFIHTNLPLATAPIFLPEEHIQVQCFSAHQDENGTNHKSATNAKPGKIAAYSQQQCRPWLKQNPPVDHANSGNKKGKEEPKLQPPGIDENTDSAFYLELMEEVANKTRGAFLKHYGDDSVHVQFQELWKLKMKNKKVKIGCLAGKFSPEGVPTTLDDLNLPYEKRDERRRGAFAEEEAPLTTTSFPLSRGSIQFQCFPSYQDGYGTNSIPAAASVKLEKTGSCKQQPSRSWPANSGFEEAKSNKTKLWRRAKKQQRHRPWLKQKPSANQHS